MEVHHHSHSHPNGKKKWRAYTWEFVMLFFAVFCGMLAEYKLEHIIEHQREKTYIRSLIKDLDLDIASMQESYNSRKLQMMYFDSLTSLLKNGNENQMNDFYFYARHIHRNAGFQYHDRTIQQLKNSGNLRLIRNQNAADSITVYDNDKMKRSLIQLEVEGEFRRFINYNFSGKLFDPFTWNDLSDSTGKIIRPTNNPSLITKDPTLLSEYAFKVVTLRGTLALTNRFIAATINSAQNLIELLKKEYGLK